MTDPLRLVIFDVDGTLVDSQADIVAGMQHAFGVMDLPAPSPEAILATVGLSLPLAMAELAPQASADAQADMVATYKRTYMQLRQTAGSAQSSPMFPGALEALELLHSDDNLLLGVATGKSRRGLELLLDAHDLRRFFVTRQCADDHPSKPNPSMIFACLSETGVAPDNAVMVGDASFDVDMARTAGIASIGVRWGYQPAEKLGADLLIGDFSELPGAVAQLMEPVA